MTPVEEAARLAHTLARKGCKAAPRDGTAVVSHYRLEIAARVGNYRVLYTVEQSGVVVRAVPTPSGRLPQWATTLIDPSDRPGS